MLLETGALRESVTVQQRLLIDLARLEALGNGGPSTAPVGVQSLLSLVDGTARTHGFSPRMRADGPDAVNVTFERVPFDGLLRWLIQLETTHGVSVESASFSGARERGLVNGQLFLRRS